MPSDGRRYGVATRGPYMGHGVKAVAMGDAPGQTEHTDRHAPVLARPPGRTPDSGSGK